MTELGRRARSAAEMLAAADTDAKNSALAFSADALEKSAPLLMECNAEDIAAGEKNGMSTALLDRLRLTGKRIADMADGIREVMQLPDPVGHIISESIRPNGLRLVKFSVPLGVLGVIYESRPNVTVDSAALCLKSGNAVILRGGREAICTNRALADCMRSAVKLSGLPEDCVQLVQDTSRESAAALMRLNGYVDALIPRGGSGLIRTVLENATVPVIQTGAGTCHTYVDKAADIGMAAQIIYNAKTSRPSVCNACECMLIHSDIARAALPQIAALLSGKNVEIRGDALTLQILKNAVPACEDDWGKEYNDYIIACKIVSSEEEAIRHIRRYGTGHSECIVTGDPTAAERFLNAVDAAAVYHNASTRFTDGYEFGLGAEIGISTQKLHARGPLGLNELTIYKYKVYGNGQVRV